MITPFRLLFLAIPLSLAAVVLTAFGAVEGESACAPGDVSAGDESNCEVDLENQVDEQLFVFIEAQQPEGIEATTFADLANEPVCFTVEPPDDEGDQDDAGAEDEEDSPEFVCAFFLDGEASIDLGIDFRVDGGCQGALELANLRGIGLTEDELQTAINPFKSRKWMPLDEEDNPDPAALVALYAEGELAKGGQNLVEALLIDEDAVADDEEPTDEQQEALDAVFTVSVGVNLNEDANCQPPEDDDGEPESNDLTPTPTATVAPTSTPDTIGSTTARTQPEVPDDPSTDTQPTGTVPQDQSRTDPNSDNSSGGDSSPTNTGTTTVGTTQNSSRLSPAIATGDGSYDTGSANWWLMVGLLTLTVAALGVPIVFWTQRDSDEN